MPWEKVEVVWGDTSKNLPWSCNSGGSQTIHAMTRAAHAAATDAITKLQQIAAKDLGGKPEDYEVSGERVHRKGGGAGMSLAQAAKRAIELGGIYDGHELPKDINAMTTRSATALAGQGLMGVGEGQLQARRNDAVLHRRVCRGRSRHRNREVQGHGLSLRGRRRHRDSPDRARRPDTGPFDTRHRSRDRSPVDL